MGYYNVLYHLLWTYQIGPDEFQYRFERRVFDEKSADSALNPGEFRCVTDMWPQAYETKHVGYCYGTLLLKLIYTFIEMWVYNCCPKKNKTRNVKPCEMVQVGHWKAWICQAQYREKKLKEELERKVALGDLRWLMGKYRGFFVAGNGKSSIQWRSEWENHLISKGLSIHIMSGFLGMTGNWKRATM